MRTKISPIHHQRDMSPKSMVLACAEGLLGELIKYARLGFSDLATEEPLHHTVQLIAAARGYSHHHEYPVIKTKGRGDHKRLDFVFCRAISTAVEGKNVHTIPVAAAVEMKVIGRSSENKAEPWDEEDLSVNIPKRCKDVTKDLWKIRTFMRMNRSSLRIPVTKGFLMVVNLDSDLGIRWDVKLSGGVQQQDVSLIERYQYCGRQIQKSVTVYEVNPSSRQ